MEGGQRFIRLGDKGSAFRRRDGAQPARAVEQADAPFRFKQGDGLAYRRQRDMRMLRRFRECSGFGHLDNVFELFEIHRLPPLIKH